MATRQEIFNRKKKALSGGSDNSSSSSVVVEDKNHTAEFAACFSRIGKIIKKSGEESIRVENVRVDKQERKTLGRSFFDEMIITWAGGDISMINLYLGFFLYVPIGLYYGITHNYQSGLVMGVFIYAICRLFIYLLREWVIQEMKNSLIDKLKPWFRVEMKSYNPFGSSVFSILNMFHWTILKGTAVTMVIMGLLLPIVVRCFMDGVGVGNSISYFSGNFSSYIFTFVIFSNTFNGMLWLGSYIWNIIYIVIARTTIAFMGSDSYRLYYLFGDKIYKKSF